MNWLAQLREVIPASWAGITAQAANSAVAENTSSRPGPVTSVETAVHFHDSVKVVIPPQHLQLGFSVPLTNRSIRLSQTLPPSVAQYIGAQPAIVTRHPLMGQETARTIHGEVLPRDTREVLEQAIFDRPEPNTFEQLGRVRHAAQEAQDEYTERSAQYGFAIAAYRAGQIDSVLEALRPFDTADAPDDVLTVLALATKADIQLGRALLRRNGHRRDLFTDARRLLVLEIPAVLRRLPQTLDGPTQNVLAEVYFYMALAFLNSHYPEYALDTARTLVELFPDSNAARQALAEKGPFANFLVRRDGALQLRNSGEIPGLWQRVVAAAKEMVHRAHFDDGANFWKVAAVGGAVAMVCDVLAGGTGSYISALADMALGGTGAVVAAKTMIGCQAPETQQAWQTGHTDYSNMDAVRASLGEAIKALGTYAFLGGVLPGVSHLPDFFVAHTDPNGWSSIYGLGSAEAFALNAAREYGTIALDAMSRGGVVAGAGEFLEILRTTTLAGSAFGNGVDFVAQTSDYAMTEMPDDVARAVENALSFSWQDPVSIAMALGKIYMGVAGLYAFGMLMRPDLQKHLTQRIPNLALIEMALMPGAYAATVGIGVLSGVKLNDALMIPLICYGVQARHHLMGGQRIKLREIDWAAMMRAGGVQLLYLAPGAAMIDGLQPQTMVDRYMLNLGMGPLLISIGLVHGWIIGFGAENVGKSKIAKYPTYDALGNIAKMMFGWMTWGGTLAGVLIKEIGLGAAVTRAYPEAVGSSTQYTALLRSVLNLRRARETGDADIATRQTDFENALAEGGRRWNFFDPLAPRNLAQAIPPLMAFYTSAKKQEPGFQTLPNELFFRRTILRFLMDESIQPEVVEAFLIDSEQMLNRTNTDTSDRRDVQRNLLVTINAARMGVHKETIQAFLARNAWMVGFYGVGPDDEALQTWRGLRARRWFARRMIGSSVSSDGIIVRPVTTYEHRQAGAHT